MIRVILSVCLMVYSLVSMMFGCHPVYSIVAGIIGMSLLGWYFTSKFEDNPPYARY